MKTDKKWQGNLKDSTWFYPKEGECYNNTLIF